MQLIGRFDKLLFSALGDGKILVRVMRRAIIESDPRDK